MDPFRASTPSTRAGIRLIILTALNREIPVSFQIVRTHLSAVHTLPANAFISRNITQTVTYNTLISEERAKSDKLLASILPPLELSEALELTRIYSIAGLLPPDKPLQTVWKSNNRRRCNLKPKSCSQAICQIAWTEYSSLSDQGEAYPITTSGTQGTRNPDKHSETTKAMRCN